MSRPHTQAGELTPTHRHDAAPPPSFDPSDPPPHPVLSVTPENAASEADAPARSGVFRHLHFRNIWFAALVSNVGNWMELLGIQMIVAHETGSLTKLGYLAAAQLVPILVFGLIGGLLADRVNRKKLLIVTQLMLMLIAAALALCSWRGIAHYWVLMALSFAQGTVYAFNIPAWQVLTPRLVPKSDLTKAITLLGVQFNLARVVGPALAGIIMGWYGTTPLFVFNTLTFFAVVLTITTTPDAPAPPHDGSHPWKQIQAAAAFIFRNRGPLCVFFAMVLMSLLAAPLIRVLPLYVIDVYGYTAGNADKVTGWMLALLGLGAVLGGLMLKYVPEWYPKHHFIPTALAGAGLSITAFGLTTDIWPGFLAMLIVGVFWIWGFNQAWAAMQHLVPDAMRGRVMAMANVASFGVTAIGNIGAGWLGEAVAGFVDDKAFGTHAAVIVLSAALFAAAVIMLIVRVPEVDGPERLPPEAGGRPKGLFAAIHEGITARAHRPRPRSAADAAAGEAVATSEPSVGQRP